MCSSDDDQVHDLYRYEVMTFTLTDLGMWHETSCY